MSTIVYDVIVFGAAVNVPGTRRVSVPRHKAGTIRDG